MISRFENLKLLPSVATLAHWLGPWADPATMPDSVQREEVVTGARRVRVYVYRGTRRPPSGAYLVSPGLHFQGFDDPRMDRFCRILAEAGLLVVAPFLPDYLNLLISATAADDLAEAWDFVEQLAREERLGKPALFAVSFGSAPAIELASRQGYGERIGSLLLFGGFADIRTTVRFCLTGKVDLDASAPVPPEIAKAMAAVPHDPLNIPAVFLNVLSHVVVPEALRGRLAEAWHVMVRRTWGRIELKRGDARAIVAEELAAALPSELREPFLMGCGLHPGGVEFIEQAIRSGAFEFINLRPRLAQLRAPVIIIHGVNDDVIPCAEAYKIRAALAPGHPHRLIVTGLYGHARPEGLQLRGLTRELGMLLELLHTLVAAPRGNLGVPFAVREVARGARVSASASPP